jgi:endonuclease YncB( thermonuclease family)
MGFREKAFAIVCIAALAACEPAAAPSAPTEAPPTQAEAPATDGSEIVGVASVTDGDTIEIRGQAIRIHGVDAPERGKRCGDVNVYQQASLALADIIGTQTVSCAPNGRDGDRIVATCSVGGVDVAETTTEQGWTRDWPRYSSRAYADEEAEARGARRGIWGLECGPDTWDGRNYD